MSRGWLTAATWLMSDDQVTAPTDSSASLWTVSDVARFLRCTPRHVVNLQANGLPYFYLGRLVRFSPEEVREYLKNHRRVAATQMRRSSQDARQNGSAAKC